MRIAIVMIFMIVATIFALATIAYVVVDIILEKRKKDDGEEEPESEIVPEDAAETAND